MNARIRTIFEYASIVAHRQDNPLSDSDYGERHHIFPKSFGGRNNKTNIVRLTPEEHYRCHRLLAEITDGTCLHQKAVFAWWCMVSCRKNLEISEEEYGILRRKVAAETAKINTGRTSYWKGKHITVEMRQAISKARKGVPRTTPIWNKGIPMREESKKKMSAFLKGREISETTKAKQRNSISKRWHSDEDYRKKHKASCQAYWDKVHAGLIKDSRYKGEKQ